MSSPRPFVAQVPTLPRVMRLAMPVLAAQLLLMLVGFSDTLLTGRYLEPAHLAAISQITYILWFLTSMFVAIEAGATALVARFVGAGEQAAARRALNQAFLLGLLLAGAVTASGLALAGPLVNVMGLDPTASALATRYLYFLLPVVPAMMVQSVGNACLRGAGDMVPGLAVMTVTNVVNVAVSWTLVRGWGGLPRWGWDGLAAGTASGYAVGGVCMLVLLVRGRGGLSLALDALRPDGDLVRRLLRVGVPAGADVLSIILCQFWFKRIVNDLGTLAAAAHGVAISIESLAYLPGTAFQVAAATLAGQYLGARQHRLAGHGVLVACLAGGGLMSAAGVMFYVAAEPLAWLFLAADQEPLARQSAQLLRIIALAMPALAITMILSGALRGAGDTRWPFLFGLIGMLAVRIPAAYLLAHWLGWGVAGAWHAMVADLYVRCLLVLYRFWHGGWKRVQV